MALKFSCKECGQDIIVRHLKAGEIAKCMRCGAENPVPTTAVQTDEAPYIPTAQPSSKSEETTQTTQEVKRKAIEICFPDGQIQQYDEYTRLREEIIHGNVRKNYKARVVTKTSKASERDKKRKDKPWSTIDRVSKTDFSLQVLYRPVWAHSMKYAQYGVLTALILYFLRATWVWFSIHPVIGVVWFIIGASLLLGIKWLEFIPVGLVLSYGASWVLGFNQVSRISVGNFYFVWCGGALLSFILGGPAGMILGTILGYFRKAKISKAQDYEPERTKTYIIALLIPAIFLLVVIPLYIFWLIPKLLDWLPY